MVVLTVDSSGAISSNLSCFFSVLSVVTAFSESLSSKTGAGGGHISKVTGTGPCFPREG